MRTSLLKHWLALALCIGFTLILAMGASAVTGVMVRADTGQVHNSSEPDDSAANPSFLELLQKGGPIMYPLYLCSILMIAFTIERAINLRRRKVSPRETVEALRAEIDADAGTTDIPGLLQRMQNQGNPLSRIATACLCRADRPILEIEKAAEDAASKEVASLQRNNRVLSSVASVAPLLGLLGTVTGIIRTFMTVSKDEEALGRTSRLAGGIYEALVATAVGLFIAISALVLYFFFQERIDRLTAEVDAIITRLLEKMSERQAK